MGLSSQLWQHVLCRVDLSTLTWPALMQQGSKGVGVLATDMELLCGTFTFWRA